MSLKTYTGSDLNNISNTLKKYLEERKLKPNDIVKYRLLTGVPNKDPLKAKGEEYLFPSVQNISVNGWIIDPGDEVKDEQTGNVKTINDGAKQIAAVRFFDDRTKQPVFKKFYVRPEKGDNGIFMIKGNSADDLEIYDLLELSNQNKSNPYRDESVQPIFERVDEVAEGQERSNKRNYLKLSWDAIGSKTYEELRVLAAGYNLNTLLDKDVLKDKLEVIAEANPELFFKSFDSDEIKITAVISLAKAAGVIEFIAHENKWNYKTGETIVTLKREEGADEMKQFTEFLKNNANGDKILGNLKKLTAATKKK